MPVFCVTVTMKTGEKLCPIFVKADGPRKAISLARSNGLIEEGEKATAGLVNGQASLIDFGSDVIAVGDFPEK